MVLSRKNTCGCLHAMTKCQRTNLNKSRQNGVCLHVGNQFRSLHTLVVIIFASQLAWGLAKAQSTIGVWKTGSWGDCNGSTCGAGGVQLRSVFCEHSTQHYKTTQNNCNRIDKPTDTKECFKVCPIHHSMFEWKTGPWGTCMSSELGSPEKVDCNIPGFQTRTVKCVNSSDSTTTVEDYICLRFNPVPVTDQLCKVSCPQNCVTSVFTSWSQCSRSCGNGTQTRTRRIIKRSKFGGKECPGLLESKPCLGLPQCQSTIGPTSTHNFRMFEWTVCKRTQASWKPYSKRGNKKWGKRERATINEHLIGLRSQTIQCLTSNGQAVGNTFTRKETCAMLQACTVDLWSAWSNCSAVCGRNGTQIRTRNIQRLPFGSNSSACPKLIEERKCLVPPQSAVSCHSYRWASGGWSGCELVHNATCGGGQQWRDVYCIQLSRFVRRQANAAMRMGGEDGANAWAQMQPVDESFCEQKEKMTSWRQCNIPCSRGCVMGEWSDWSACVLPACPGDLNYTEPNIQPRRSRNIKGFQRRHRKVYENVGPLEDCPHTLEVTPCDNARCYHWHVTSLSPCRPDSGECGSGIIMQSLVCRDLWRNKVPDSKCHRAPSAHVVPRLLTCHVPCPGDCVLSEWGEWTPCTHTCKRGKKGSQMQIRKRGILAFPGPTGTPCPHTDALQQSRQCNQQKCSVYFWPRPSWSPCQIMDASTPVVGMNLNLPGEGGVASVAASESKGVFVYPQSQTPGTCKIGYQTREVRCTKKDSGSVRRKMCIAWDKPTTVRSCAVGCRQDCILSQWSEWSSCSLECDKLISNLNSAFQTPTSPSLISVYQRRRRYVVQHRVGSGEPCRLELEQLRRCDDSEQCSLFQWQTSKWSPCVVAKEMAMLFKGQGGCLGVNTRSVKCRRLTMAGYAQAAVVKCLQHAAPIPHATRPCLANCPRSSKLRKWMKKIGCKATLTPSLSSDFTRPPQTDAAQLGSERNGGRPVSRPAGPWSSCIVDDDDYDWSADDCPASPMTTGAVPKPAYSLLRETRQCGHGMRRRALACYDDVTGAMLNFSQCSYRPYVEEDCEVPCPLNCEMSKWTHWGLCGELAVDATTSLAPPPDSYTPCGENLRFRYQEVIQNPRNGGRSCPAHNQLRQSRPCRTDCDENFWVATSWESCDVFNATSINSCGGGIQTRNVKCYVTSRREGRANYGKREDDFLLCDISSMPLGSRKCNATCPDNCVVSQWSSWQPCVSPGEGRVGQTGSCSGASRIRTRRIMRQPNVAALSDSVVKSLCPEAQELEQTEPCQLNENCFTYSIKWMEWGSCLLGGDAKCGEGRKYRKANCMKSTGHPVHPSKCTKHDVTVPDPQSTSCHVNCPIDCLVGDWSTWTTCSDVCTLPRTRTRSRKILRHPSPSGRHCPRDLIQTRPCCSKPCYAWKLEAWGDCEIEEGNCGVGRRRREVACRQQDGTNVDDNFCRLQNDRSSNLDLLYDRFPADQLTAPCQVPCPGECRATEWSSWSRCHADCKAGDSLVNANSSTVKTRSRVLFVVGNVEGVECDLNDTEEIECPTEEAVCFTYKWRVGQYLGGRRDVWCERTQDGLRVSTGCTDDEKPDEIMEAPECEQPCDEVENGLCLPTGECGCPTSYRAVIQSSVLITCVDPDKQQDEGTIEVINSRGVHDETGSEDVIKEEPTTTSYSPPVEIKPLNESEADIWDNLNPVKQDGSLKIWAYGAIAGLAILLVFIIAIIYLLYSACHKASNPKSGSGRKKRRHHRRNTSGTNVGVGLVVSSGGGSSMFGTGGSGLPPYYTAAVPAAGGQRFPGMRALSRTPSARSGFSFPDRYDSDD